jgi:hypothetical protein
MTRRGQQPAPPKKREIVLGVRTREGKATVTVTGSDAEMDRIEAYRRGQQAARPGR